MDRFRRKLWIGLVVMALLSPLGVIVPRVFHAEGAWGEWAPATLRKLLGYVPEGLRRTSEVWKAPIPQYGLNAEGSSLLLQTSLYVASGLLGLAMVALLIYILSKYLGRHER